MRNGQKTVLVINGANLNLLGIREPHIYGHETLRDVENTAKEQGKTLNAQLDFFQRYIRIHYAEPLNWTLSMSMPVEYRKLTVIPRN